MQMSGSPEGSKTSSTAHRNCRRPRQHHRRGLGKMPMRRHENGQPANASHHSFNESNLHREPFVLLHRNGFFL